MSHAIKRKQKEFHQTGDEEKANKILTDLCKSSSMINVSNRYILLIISIIINIVIIAICIADFCCSESIFTYLH